MKKSMLDKLMSAFLIVSCLLFFRLENSCAQNVFGLNVTDWATKSNYSPEANYWYQQSGITYRTVPGHSYWDDIYQKADFSVDFDDADYSRKPVSACILFNTVAVPRIGPASSDTTWRNAYPKQFVKNADGTWSLTDTSLTFSKYLDLWLENYAKPSVEYYASKGCYIIDFGNESWPVHYWDTTNGVAEMGNIRYAGEAWYPFDKLSDAPEVPVVEGESILTSLLNSQYALIDYDGDALLKSSFDQTLWGLRDAIPPTPPIPNSDPSVMAQIFTIAGQLRAKDDYIAGKIRDAYRRLHEWKMQYYPKMVIAFSTHGNFLQTLYNHAGEISYVDWMGPDYTPGAAGGTDATEFGTHVYAPLSSAITNTSNKIWGMGTFEDALRFSPTENGLAGTPYANISLSSESMSNDLHRCIGPTFQDLCDYFYSIDNANKYIKCFFVNRPFQSEKYGVISAANPPSMGPGWGAHTLRAPYSFVDSDEPLGTTITPRPNIQDPNLALWDGDGDGLLDDQDDPLLEIRGFGNRWGRGNPELDGSGNPVADIAKSKYSYLKYKMYNPLDAVYPYWRTPCPMIPNWEASSYDYQTQQLTLSLKNTVGPVQMTTDCLVFKRSTFAPPWTNVVKAKPEDIDSSLPAADYTLLNVTIAGKAFNSTQQPVTSTVLSNYSATSGRYCFVYLKDKPGVKGLAGVNEISQYSDYALTENAYFKGYLDVRNILAANTGDTISVRAVVTDGKGFETVLPTLQKQATLVYGGMDFIPISYNVSDSDGGIMAERIEYKRSSDSSWTAIDSRELIQPVHFSKYTASQIVVNSATPFAASSGFCFGFWSYRPGSTTEQNLLVKNATYRIHLVAHSPNGATMTVSASSYTADWQLLGYTSTSLNQVALTSQAQEYVSDEFTVTNEVSAYDLIYIYRTNQQGMLCVDKAWLEMTDRAGDYQVLVPDTQPFTASSGFSIGYWQYHPNTTLEQNLLQKHTTYRLHVVAHSPNNAVLTAETFGFNAGWQTTEHVFTGISGIALGTTAQEYVGYEFMLSSPATVYPLLYFYRLNNQGTLIIDEAWLEVKDVFKDSSLYQEPVWTYLDPEYKYRLHVIASSPSGTAKFGATAVGYDGNGLSSANLIESQATGFWDVTLAQIPQEYVSDVFYMHDIATKEAIINTYRSNQSGTLVVEKAWLSVEGLRPELIELISPEAGLIASSGYFLRSYAFDPSKQYQLSAVVQSPNGSTLAIQANGYNSSGAVVEQHGVLNVSPTSAPQLFTSQTFYLSNVNSMTGYIAFYRANQQGQLEIKRAWLTMLGNKP